MSNLVCLEHLESYDIDLVQQSVEICFNKLNMADLLKDKKTVLLKVCLPRDSYPDSAQTTHPSVVRAVVNILTNYGIKCVVADSPYGNYSISNLDRVYINSGMLEVANQTNCELNHNLKTCVMENPDGFMWKSLTLLDVVNNVDAIINLGKLKIDSTLVYFGASANLFGLVPGEVKTEILNRLTTLKDFYNYNLDIYQVLEGKLVLNVLDAVVAMEAENTPRMFYCLGVSKNCFSLDETIIDILDISKEKTVINQAERRDFHTLNQNKVLAEKDLRTLKINDFALTDFNERTLLHINEGERKKYFKNNQKRVFINGKKCKGCQICTKICPTKALTMKYDKNGELYATVDYNKCIFCYKCITACPYKVVDIIEPNGYKKLHKEIEKINSNQ